MPSKVQTLRGDFTFQKSGWPKVEYPNISEGLIRDYRVEDLADGPVTEWVDRIVGAKLVNSDPSVLANPVVTFEDGRRSVVFAGNTRFQEWFTVPANLSIAVVYNASSLGHNTNMRLVSGADGFRYFAPNMTSMAVQVATGAADKRITLGTVNASGLVRDQWGAAVLSHANATSLSAKVLGGTYVTGKILAEPQPVVQSRLILGYNSAAVANNITGFHGKVARLMVWDRALAPVDMDAVLIQNKKMYNLP